MVGSIFRGVVCGQLLEYIIPIALGIVLQIINRKIAEKASTALPIISVVAISLIFTAIVAGGSKHQILTTGLLIF